MKEGEGEGRKPYLTFLLQPLPALLLMPFFSFLLLRSETTRKHCLAMQANFLQVTLVKLWFYKTKQLADFRKFWLFWLPHSVFDVFRAVSSFFFVILLFSDPPYIPAPPPVNQVSQWPSQFQAYPSLPCLFFLFCHVLW